MTRWDAGWSMRPGGAATLVLAAGADRQLAIDGLAPDTVQWALALDGAPIDATTDEQRLLLDRLVEIGAVVADVPTRPTIMFMGGGAAVDGLAERLAGHGIATADHADLTIVVRSGGEWPESPPAVHLGVDLTLHHTVLIGPLVLPGASACLRCLQARTDHLWPRASVPIEPRVARFLGGVADLLAIQIELVAASRSTLVNATIAWDLERGTSDRQSLYKLTGCAGCGPAPSVGRVHLPWATGATT